MSLPNVTLETTDDERAEYVRRARIASDLLKALSHETRLLLLCLMHERERSVSELEDLLCMPQATVSQHLARLRYDRLVTTRREGRMIYYSIVDSDIADLVAQIYQTFCSPERVART
ncbi:helix-turn-helix transcriptional regulator [Notoacmeibacter sp. MSK16QG-6]|uniref:ArsR/SmtB family transcription factor n=1 Tax=Notoacmeibacter sp. MSK16QG-6 TaxID=2957982 RepID=UPI00209F77B4|nr:metalloregulator ArsR/SmtB family transcription factor [Notoacmeibacter sp. MSK16QG-6]MCP1200809.1 metalloregulator ArsR/SmtB family transcription factor [Notoacmeibacter sp. MSK16QG-6]